MAITLRQTSAVGGGTSLGTSGTTTCAFSSTTLAGSTIVIVAIATHLAVTHNSVADPVNTPYALATEDASTGDPYSGIFYFLNASSVTSAQNITLTWASGTGSANISLVALEFTGVTGLDGVSPAQSAAGPGPISAGPLTPNNPGCVFIGCGNNSNASSQTNTWSGSTPIVDNAASTSGSAAQIIVSGLTAQTASWSFGGTHAWAGVIAAFDAIATLTDVLADNANSDNW